MASGHSQLPAYQSASKSAEQKKKLHPGGAKLPLKWSLREIFFIIRTPPNKFAL